MSCPLTTIAYAPPGSIATPSRLEKPASNPTPSPDPPPARVVTVPEGREMRRTRKFNKSVCLGHRGRPGAWDKGR